MNLALFANGEVNEDLKPAITELIEALDLSEEGRFLCRKLMSRQQAELERDFHTALDQLFFSLEPVADWPNMAHRVQVIYMVLVEEKGELTESEITLAQELAETLALDVDYYLDRTD
ncbi:hypothetical protein [Pantoea sp. ICBG 1758]|uniref:hypothetical protein n=1 Tax=Pantoea sp. ICBG 1758 TaxID=2071682 RepID=UPI001304CC54|nr:hypothetical protein [Pantoea sp. ICBG 1758]